MKTNIYLLLFLFATSSISAQILTSVVPDSATQCQQLTITVTGENTDFYQGTSFISLYQQDYFIGSTNNTVISSTQIEAVFYFNPDQPIGSYDVSVYSYNWGDIILPDGFTLNPPAFLPQLTALNPDTAYQGESVVITITGENTHFGINGINSLAWFTSTTGGYLNATSVTASDSLHLVANLAVNTNTPPGIYTLHVSNALDGELELPDVLVVIENEQNPEIVSVDPNSAHQGEGLTITVTGTETNFMQGSSMLQLYNSNSNPLLPINQEVVNDSILTGYFEFSNDNDAGYYDVKVINWLLEDLVLEDGFRLFESGDNPNLLSISPNSAYQGTAVTFLISAENTHFDNEGNPAYVTLIQGSEELYSREIRVIDSVTLEADFVFSYNNYTGYRDLIVTTPFDGTMSLNSCVWIFEAEPNASIVSVVPDSANLGDILTISITGTNIVFMQGTSNISLSKDNFTISTPNEIIVNDTIISGVFDFTNTYPLGKYDVNIDNGLAWPSMILADGFTLRLFDFIDETNSIALLTVYPNPTGGLLNIKRNFNVKGIFDLLIYDTKGHLLLEDNIEDSINEKQIDLTSYAKGIYLLKVIQNQNEQTERFIIQ